MCSTSTPHPKPADDLDDLSDADLVTIFAQIASVSPRPGFQEELRERLCAHFFTDNSNTCTK